jgi:predicted dithiol-disulfide oxidoreductase (DUF899 family)
MRESPGYAKRRAELREAEIALAEQRERVAELRRRLPLDTAIEDGAFLEEAPDGGLRELRLSDLFDEPDRTLVLVHFMFGKKQEEPCPMCTLWADGYDGIVPHLRQRVSFAVVVAGDPRELARYGRERGWRHLRIVSSGDGPFKRALGMEADDGGQMPGVSVFRRAGDGSIRHFYTGGALFAPGRFRGMDLLTPFWSFLDLTPEGRGDFVPRRRYDTG